MEASLWAPINYLQQWLDRSSHYTTYLPSSYTVDMPNVSSHSNDNSLAIRLCRSPSGTFPAQSWTIRAVWSATRRAWCTSPCCWHRHHRRCRPSGRNHRLAAVAVGPACRRYTTRRPCLVTANWTASADPSSKRHGSAERTHTPRRRRW